MYLKKWMYGNNAALLLLLHYYENYISTAHEKQLSGIFKYFPVS